MQDGDEAGSRGPLRGGSCAGILRLRCGLEGPSWGGSWGEVPPGALGWREQRGSLAGMLRPRCRLEETKQ